MPRTGVRPMSGGEGARKDLPIRFEARGEGKPAYGFAGGDSADFFARVLGFGF